MSDWSRRTSWSTRRRWELTIGTCWLSFLGSWMNRSHNAKTNECPDYTAIHSLIYLLAVQLHGILSTLFFFFMHYFRRQLLFSWTSSSVATFSHTAAFKSFLAFHSSSLPNHSLSTLCKTAVMSSDLFTERHLFRLYTCLTHFIVTWNPSSQLRNQSARLDICSRLHFSYSNCSFLFLFLCRFLTQDNQEQKGTAPTERPVDSP